MATNGTDCTSLVKDRYLFKCNAISFDKSKCTHRMGIFYRKRFYKFNRTTMLLKRTLLAARFTQTLRCYASVKVAAYYIYLTGIVGFVASITTLFPDCIASVHTVLHLASVCSVSRFTRVYDDKWCWQKKDLPMPGDPTSTTISCPRAGSKIFFCKVSDSTT